MDYFCAAFACDEMIDVFHKKLKYRKMQQTAN